MHPTRPSRYILALAIAAVAALFVPAVASALPAGGGGGVSPPTTAPKKTAPPTTTTPTTTPAPKVTSPIGTLPGTTGVFQQMPPPAVPGIYPLQASEYSVVVSWYDRSNDENSFAVYRRDGAGNWQKVYDVPTRDTAGVGDNYSWVDDNQDQSGQCYMLAAEGSYGTGYSSEECTVRPDPRQFPQSFPPSTQQWYGLSGTNDGTGPLVTGAREAYTNLTWSSQTFGVSLDWSDSTSLWKVQAPGGPEVMYGEAVALRVWGGGWLKYGQQTFGVDLQLSDTPSYEWYLLGEPPGNQVDSGEFALWDSAAHDYLVLSNETWGVDLNWYQKTQAQSSSTTPPPPQGWAAVVAYNCTQEARPLEMWVEDYTAGTGFVDKGQLNPLWSDEEGGCSVTSDDVTTYNLITGHTYLFRAIDFDAPGCSNDPTLGACDRDDLTIMGNANGPAYPDEIG